MRLCMGWIKSLGSVVMMVKLSILPPSGFHSPTVGLKRDSIFADNAIQFPGNFLMDHDQLSIFIELDDRITPTPTRIDMR